MKTLITCLALYCFTISYAQQPAGKNAVIVTIDGIRWQELFSGADSGLLFNKKYIEADSAEKIRAYWSEDPVERRKKLFPFIWTHMAGKGQVYGNRMFQNNMQVKNPYWYSYPGYNEIFTGYADTAIHNNNFGPNKNENVLAFINRQPAYKNKVAAFTNWTTFGDILNQDKNGYLVSNGNKPLPPGIIARNEKLRLLDKMQQWMPSIWETDRLDALTYAMAKEYMQQWKPRLLYISLGEADEWAHSARYDLYLDAAHKADEMIRDLWTYIQSSSFYKNNTYLIITTDHGRGHNEKWTSHNSNTPFSGETWMAVYGPGITGKGEMKNKVELYNVQIASTLASLLGFDYKAVHPVYVPIEFMTK